MRRYIGVFIEGQALLGIEDSQGLFVGEIEKSDLKIWHRLHVNIGNSQVEGVGPSNLNRDCESVLIVGL